MGQIADSFKATLDLLIEIDRESQRKTQETLNRIDQIIKRHDEIMASYDRIENELQSLIDEFGE